MSVKRRDPCTGCDHSLSRHYKDVTGTVRCLVVESGTSSKGIIGLPWYIACDCVGYRSKRATEERAAEKRDQKDREREMREWMKSADVKSQLKHIRKLKEPTR